ncbi:hypothetical protein [Nonomuraea cavernae]|uniref:Tyr recombinase domain-containing protein n=1 Tax=Nonomuraea cavernae TaxID=2045107 RepID=A0A917ZE80_9ACTN|nr:hypothetical protein [Nonomuraea cavernae]MCA2187554.1 hypothetical protein [Nonomuraea cavernae]GGO80229.1 hypothetical protein GCM10012289_66370 [Nonomuraea cavernae]
MQARDKQTAELVWQVAVTDGDPTLNGNSIAVSSGAILKDLMQRMGHDSVRAALIYQHSTAEADRKIADAMNVKFTEDANGSSKIPHTGQWHEAPFP